MLWYYMRIKLTINVPPFSINKAFLRNRSYSKPARLWRHKVITSLQEPLNKSAMAHIASIFDKSLHTLSVTYISYYPRKVFTTKEGHLSHRTMDLTNTEKLLQDIICDKKYSSGKFLRTRKGWERSLYAPLSSISNLDIDDTFISDLKSEKRPTESLTAHQEVHISIVPLTSIL